MCPQFTNINGSGICPLCIFKVEQAQKLAAKDAEHVETMKQFQPVKDRKVRDIEARTRRENSLRDRREGKHFQKVPSSLKQDTLGRCRTKTRQAQSSSDVRSQIKKRLNDAVNESQ